MLNVGPPSHAQVPTTPPSEHKLKALPAQLQKKELDAEMYREEQEPLLAHLRNFNPKP